MFDKLQEVEQKFLQLEGRLSDPDLANCPDEFRKLSQEHSNLIEVVDEFRKYKSIKSEIESNKELIADAEYGAIAREELKRLEPEFVAIQEKLQILLLPQDPNDGKNIILELRAGAGGEEAGLFVAALYRAYQRYAERQGWKVEVLSSNPTGMGGLREIISQIEGNRVYAKLKFEGGVHRVQRVPETEAQGRVHTSTITVAVLPEAEEVDVTINPAELRIDVFRSGGAGGQGVNTTDSAVRITHLPTNTVVVCQDERSQLKNKAKAMKILRSRILEVAVEKAAKEHSDARRSMVGTGDRSERIRTYNFPQSRMTDHRIGLTLHQLPEIMEGKLEPVIDALTRHHQIEVLKEQGVST